MTPPLADPARTRARRPSCCASGAYARTYALAQRLSAARETQEDYVQAVLRYLRGDDFAYTESPPLGAENLDGFLFDAKSGYCQQFSGAMALLLRMGGVPARVSTGFTTGLLDRKAGEYVVRDLDAHSWVEVWYSGYRLGDVGPDAGRRARALAGRRRDAGGGGASRGAPDLGGDIRTDPQPRRRRDRGQGTPWTLIALGVGRRAARGRRSRCGCRAATAAALAAGWGPVAELERALRARAPRARPGGDAAARSRRCSRARPRPPATCARCASSATPAAPAAADAPPDGARCAPSWPAAAASAGRLRAWWALPPRPR